MENPNSSLVSSEIIQSQENKYTENDFVTFHRVTGSRIMLALRAMVFDGATDAACGAFIHSNGGDVPVEFIAAFIAWRAWRDAIESDTKARARDKALARQWVSTISAKTQHLSLKSLDVVAKNILDGDAKSMANSTRAASTLVAMARQAEGMDRKDSDTASDSAISIAVFFVPSPRKAREMQQAQQQTVTEGCEDIVKADTDLF